MPTTPTRFAITEQDCHGRTHFRAVRIAGTIEGSHQIDFDALADAMNSLHAHARRERLLPATVDIYRVSFNPRPARQLIRTVEWSTEPAWVDPTYA